LFVKIRKRIIYQFALIKKFLGGNEPLWQHLEQHTDTSDIIKDLVADHFNKWYDNDDEDSEESDTDISGGSGKVEEKSTADEKEVKNDN
jgi:hypothetical protein